MRGDGMFDGEIPDFGELLFEGLEESRERLEMDFLAGTREEELGRLETELVDQHVRGEAEVGLADGGPADGRLTQRVRFAAALADLADGHYSGRAAWTGAARHLVFLLTAGACQLLARILLDAGGRGGPPFIG